MRGKQLFTYLTRENPRNIPAYAGKTSDGVHIDGLSEEHPRVCGENAGPVVA